MEFLSCVNCSVDFDEADQKHFTLHIVLPTDFSSIPNPQQVFQAVEIPVIDTLKEVFNLRSLDDQDESNKSNNLLSSIKDKDGHGQNSALQVPVCNNCANMLANLYLAHRTFSQHRPANSFLSKHIEQSKKRKILLVKVSNSNSNNLNNPRNTSSTISTNNTTNDSEIVDSNNGSSSSDKLSTNLNLKEGAVHQNQSQSQVLTILDEDGDPNGNGSIVCEIESEVPVPENENEISIESSAPTTATVTTMDTEPLNTKVPVPVISGFTNTFEDPDGTFNADLLCEVKVEEFETDHQLPFDTEVDDGFNASTSSFLQDQQHQQQQPQLLTSTNIAPVTPARVFTVSANSFSQSQNQKNVIGSQKRIEPTNNICFAQPLLIASINPPTVGATMSTMPTSMPTIPLPLAAEANFGISSLTGAMRPPTQTIISGPTCQPRINLLNLPLDQMSHPSSSISSTSALLLDDGILNNMSNMSSKLKQIPLCRPGATIEVSDPTRRMYVVPKGGPPFQCPDCPQMFMLPVVYRNHILAHIKKQEENGLTCKLCPAFRFETLNDLIAHHRYNHEDSENDNKDSKEHILRCDHPDCYYIATSTADSLHHQVYKHSQQVRNKVPMARSRKEENELIRLHLLGASMEIDFIEEKFPLKQDDKPDVLSPTNNNNNHSSSGSSALKTFSIVFPDLTCHFTISDGPPYRCPFCSKPFNCNTNWQSLKKHITDIHLTFLSGRTYNCKRCNKDFDRSSSLRNHQRRCGKPELKKSRPIQPKIFKCDRCPRKFSSEKNKQVHLTHCGTQSFPCEICGLVFARNCKLVSHMYKHATSRPFICDQCGRSYKNKHGLSFHQKISHTEEGRLKYNELMRNKNRQRKLRKSGLLPASSDSKQEIEMEMEIEHPEGEDGDEVEEEEDEDEEEEEEEEYEEEEPSEDEEQEEQSQEQQQQQHSQQIQGHIVSY